MSLLKDPEMEDIVIEFCDETDRLCTKLEEILDNFSSDLSKTHYLEEFGQTIDRIMGAAKSLEAFKIGVYAEMGKSISYKASQIDDKELLNIVLAVLYDAIEYIQGANSSVREIKIEKFDDFNDQAFLKRLKWLFEKFDNIKRSSVAIDDKDDV